MLYELKEFYMKKNFLIPFVLLLSFSTFAFPTKDIEVMVSVPSIMGLVCGKNALLCQVEDYENVESSLNLSAQVFGKIKTIPDFCFTWTSAVHFSSQKVQDFTDNPLSIGVSLGGGFFWNLFNCSNGTTILPLTGVSMFLYPVYDFPVVRSHYTPYWKYKVAAEFSVNYTFWRLSYYPFCRTMLMFSKDSPGFAFDWGLLVGVYL